MPASETDKVLKAQLDNIADDVRVIREIISGNGDPSKGLVVRIDRIEQREESRRWFTRATFTAAIGALIATIIKSFS